MVKKNKRSNGRMRPVTVVTMASSFERRLAKQSDVTTLRGKLLLPTSTVTSTPAALLTGSPGNFGARASSLANIFSRFRIKTLNVKWTAVSTNAVGVVALGFYDDATSGEGQAPSDVNGILEMRCSSSFMTPTTIPQEFAYRPVDSICGTPHSLDQLVPINDWSLPSTYMSQEFPVALPLSRSIM